MKVSAQEIEQRQVVLEVEVENERVERALDQAYKRIVNRINVPGFRRGRAPRPLVERMVGRAAILEDAVDHLVPQVYQDALKEQQIEPSGQPSLEVTSTEPLQFKATVPLQPKVELGDYRSIQIAAEPALVEDSEIEAVVQNLRESHATWVPVEQPAQLGHRVAMDVKARRGERELFDTKDAEFVLNPDGPEPAPGFSNQLVGLPVGEERSFSLGGSESDEGQSTPGTEFTVQLKWVKEKQLPELDDDFARTAAEKESVAELRAEIGDQIRRHKEQEARERQREAILKSAVEQSSVEIPPQLVERQAKRRLESLASTLDKQGISVEQYLQFSGKDENTFRTELLDDAAQTLKSSLVLDAIADAEGIEVSEAEIREEILSASRGASDPEKSAREALARPETKAGFVNLLRTRKALERIVELAGGGDSEPATVDDVPHMSGESDE